MQSIPIIFQGGSYGTYLIWLLNMLFTENKLHDPFNKNTGSSHNLKNIKQFEITDWLKDQSCYPAGLFLKTHPKTKIYHSFLDNLHKLTSYFGKSILIYPSDKTYLLHSNNYAYKIWNDFWAGPCGYMDRSDLYKNFPIDRNTPLDEVPTWMIREWLSYNFFNSMNAQLEWFLPDRVEDKNCLIIFIDELLYGLPLTINRIQQFIQLPLTKNIDSILPYHEKNISLQKYLTQDKLALTIIDSVKNNIDSLVWNNTDLTILTEARIQQWIRDAGYDFKCNELNQFPTSSKELINLL